MSLPILETGTQVTTQTLVRLFHQTQLNWSRHLAEEQLLDLGIALFNPELPQVIDANLIMDAVLPGGIGPADAIAAAGEFYRERGSRLSGLILSPAANPHPSPEPLKTHLEASGWSSESREILRLNRRPAASAIAIPAGTKIIPARASFRHARRLAEETTAGNTQQTDAALLHLDDPHVDALLALQDGQAVAGVSVLAMGEVGRIDQLYVSEGHRREGLGKLMLSRALEICARGLFKHVLLSTSPAETAAQALFKDFGFEPIGKIELYRTPTTSGSVAVASS
jgi:ribosomal protein S18 acetylase RimI-like enzyme